MKKFLAAILCIGILLTLVICYFSTVREYKGTPLTTLTFESIDYMGGVTTTYVFDFENNVATLNTCIPGDENNSSEPKILKEFSDEEEKTLINKLYSYGLFNIKDNYESPGGILDGGGWSLVIEYNDGTTKKSQGSNNSPEMVFKNCAKAFYDLCEYGVVSSVPTEYYCPPNVSYSFKVDNANYGYGSYGTRLDYKWNGFESSGNSVYEANETTEFYHKFNEGDQCTLVLYTANYKNSNNYDRFKKCTVTSYDYNEELTNETVIHSGGWFRQIELSLELNKIYVVRFDFRNGDFVEYTFNTKTS